MPKGSIEVVLDRVAFNRALLDSVGVGLAIVDTPSGAILAHNPRFRDLFPNLAANATIDQIVDVPDDDEFVGADVIVREQEIKIKRRAASLLINFSRHSLPEGEVMMVECHNVSKIKELEYMIESYSKMVEKNARDLRREKERAERLLLNIMPKSIYEELKAFGVTTPQRYDNASVLMLDFVGFTAMSVATDPMSLVSELNDIFAAFDRISEQFGCERIKTMGDAYMAVSGIPEATPDHALNVAKVALLCRRYVRQRGKTRPQDWQCRIGLATGPVIGSIVGVQKYVYDIFGPGVNLASRMEQASGSMEISCDETFYELIRRDFKVEERGMTELRGLGNTKIYSLISANEALDLAIA
ncbi:MAG TPA: adenylate/guanylate cyclase domain-containing protein [Methyloceanibacter sp.]|nr:adenylate/guanylate cyclase domain-containing protein [Methyloceanibacter sp.]